MPKSFEEIDLEFGPRTRVKGLRRHQLTRIAVVVPALLLALFFSIGKSSPDGAPPPPIDTFLTSLHSLDNSHTGKVRILHFGDSHIASDSETYSVRSYLQSRFGDGGAGLWLPWGGPRLASLNINYGNTYGWQRGHPSYSTPVEDTGLSLNYIEADSPDQNVWLQTSASEFRVDYLAQPSGGDAEFILDGVSQGQRRMSSNYAEVKTATFEAPGGDAVHRFEIRTLDSGPVRILGVSAEKSTPGVVYSALGLIGARAEYLLKCRAETFEAQIAAEQPDMVIFGYGTNESSGSYLDQNAYENALTTIIDRVRNAAPSALVVLLTPTDRGDSRPSQEQHIEHILGQVMAAEREVAWREGAILMDLNTAMGGAGSAERWASVRPALARPDMIHFTNEGYNLLGRYIAGGIMKLYESGPDMSTSSSPGSFGAPTYTGEILPHPSPGTSSEQIVPAVSHRSYTPEPEPARTEIYYFLTSDGQVIVTNDLSTVDTNHGKLISADEARCLLRGKSRPCDNADRW